MPTNFQQNLTFKPKPEKVLEEFSFDGGLITDENETKLQPNESPDLANVVFNTTNSVKTRNGYLRYNVNPIGTSADQSNTGASTGSLTMTTPSSYVAQTYQASGSIAVVQVDVYMAMTNSGQQQYVRAELWATSTGPSILISNGQGQIKLVTGTSETAYNYRFKVPASNAASTTYAIVIKPFVRGSTQSVNSVNVYYRGTTYANGQVYTSSDAGLTWTGDATKDLRFVVYAGGDTGGTGLIRYYNTSGVQQQFGKFGTSLYRGDDIAGTMTTITLGSGVSLTAANSIDWTISNNTLLVVDGTHQIQKYRGSTNSNYSTGTITVTNGSATITGSSTVWNTATNATTGEYIKLPDGKWYKINAIASDTSLTIERTYQGSTLSAQTYTISPWGEVQGKLNSSTAPSGLVRPTPSFIENHINRIWVLQGNSLYFSALDTTVTEENFNDWDTANNAGQINVPAGRGDMGSGLYSLNGQLFVFQHNAIWVILGTSPANFELRNISNEVGLTDKKTLIEYDAYLIFNSGKDLYIFDGTNLKNLTADRNNSLIGSFANQTSPVATLWGSYYLLAYTPSGGSTNSAVLAYDVTKDKFTKWENIYASSWIVWDGGTDTGQIYFTSSNQGTIYQLDVGGHDDGYEITTRYNTPSVGFGANMSDKVVKRVYLQQLALGDWNLTVNQYADITTETITSSINLADGTTTLWDVGKWDVDSWSDDTSLITTRINEFQGTAKYFRYEFLQVGYNEGVEILGINVTTRIRKLN